MNESWGSRWQVEVEVGRSPSEVLRRVYIFALFRRIIDVSILFSTLDLGESRATSACLFFPKKKE